MSVIVVSVGIGPDISVIETESVRVLAKDVVANATMKHKFGQLCSVETRLFLYKGQLRSVFVTFIYKKRFYLLME